MPLDWAFDAPAYWDGGRETSDWLSEDLCVWTDDDGRPAYFIRGLLELPIIGSEETFAYGVWSSLSGDSFERVFRLWDEPARTGEPPYFGWLSNRIPGYPETLNLPLDVVTVELDRRPTLLLHDGDHPLVTEQRSGIPLERVREVVERQLHAA